jgi:hypothetical protein
MVCYSPEKTSGPHTQFSSVHTPFKTKNKNVLDHVEISTHEHSRSLDFSSVNIGSKSGRGVFYNGFGGTEE